MYPHVTQFETLDGRRRLALAASLLRSERRTRRPNRKRLGRGRQVVAGCAPSA